jgi:hypothetical protein
MRRLMRKAKKLVEGEKKNRKVFREKEGETRKKGKKWEE